MKKPKIIECNNYDGIKVTGAYSSLKLKPLDFFCSKSDGLIGFGIRMVTKNLSPDRHCEFNHSGILPDNNNSTLEALWHLESNDLFEHYEGKLVLIARYPKLTPEKYLIAMKAIQKHIGQAYPKTRILFHLLNIAHLIHWTDSVVCSELVAKVLFYIGARGHHYWGTTPDNIADEIENSLNDERNGPRYDIIFKGELPILFYKYCSHCKEVHLIDLAKNNCYKCHNKYVASKWCPSNYLREEIREYNDKKANYVIFKASKKH